VKITKEDMLEKTPRLSEVDWAEPPFEHVIQLSRSTKESNRGDPTVDDGYGSRSLSVSQAIKQ